MRSFRTVFQVFLIVFGFFEEQSFDFREVLEHLVQHDLLEYDDDTKRLGLKEAIMLKSEIYPDLAEIHAACK